MNKKDVNAMVELSASEMDEAVGGVDCNVVGFVAAGITYIGLSAFGGPIGAAIGSVSGGIGFVAGGVGVAAKLVCER